MSSPPITPPEAPAPSGDEPGLSPAQLWLAVRKSWLLLLTTVAIGVLTAAFYTVRQPKIYQATGTILIDPNPPRPLGKDVANAVDLGAGAYWTNKEYYETQFQLIRSRRVTVQTVKLLGLNRDPAFLALKPADPSLPPADADLDLTADTLIGRLAVEPVRGTRLVKVTLEDADPERARRTLHSHLDVFVQQNLDETVSTSDTAGDWMRTQADKLKTDLEGSELALHEYKKKNRILSVSLDDQNNMLRDQMAQLNQEVTRVRAERERIAARVAELDKISEKDPENIPAAELLSNATINGLRTAYLDARRASEAAQAAGKGPHHPEVAAATARSELTRQALMTEVINVKRSLRRDLEATNKQISGLSKLFEHAKQEALDLNLLEIEYRRLERAKKNTERLFSVVMERSTDSDLASQIRFNNIRVIDVPLKPKAPIRPSLPTNVGGGLIIGLALGLSIALGRELLDRSLKSPEDVERALGLTSIGVIPRLAGPRQEKPRYGRRHARLEPPPAGGPPELIAHHQPAGAVAEAARAIRTNILFMSPDEPFKRLLVTSAVPSEGKTTVACGISIAMAQSGQRVLLIDCDLRRPRLHRIFEQDNRLGVSSLILDPSSLEEAIHETCVPGLSVLTSGPIPPNPAELLNSGSFAELLRQLAERFDRVIIDSPPLIPVTDAAVLSTLVSATVLVVKPFTSRKDLSRLATRSVRDVGGRILGVVLNDVDFSRNDSAYYYSGYYAYRSHGYKQESPGE